MKDSVLVLARHPKRFDREYKVMQTKSEKICLLQKEVLEWMKGNGFENQTLVQPVYTNCSYADSFAVSY